MLGRFWTSQCHGVVCSAFCALGWAVTNCLETWVHGLASLDCREFATCVNITSLGMRSTWSECPALQDLRDKRPHLFHGARADAMVLFMWQDDMIGVVRFIDECLERILYTSDQP